MSKDKKPAKNSVKAAKGNDKVARGLVIGMIALVVIAGIGITVLKKNQSVPNIVHPAIATKSTGYGLTFNNNASPTIDVWEDFQCPICKEFEAVNGANLDKLATSGKARVVFHTLSFIDDNVHKHGSHLSANAAACVANESASKWLSFHNALYANQPAENGPDLFTNAYLIKLAATIGVGDQKFVDCVNSGKYADWVQYVADDGTNKAISSTPTVLINGKEIDRNTQYMSVAGFTAALKSAGITL
jgi:protein-disulfide isomerase